MQPQQPYAPAPPPVPSGYEFITNPGKPQRPGLGNVPTWKRALIVGVGFVILLIIGSVVMNLIRGGDKSLPAMITVVQHQQSLLHLTESAASKSGISITNGSAAATINLTVGTHQKAMGEYFTINGLKVDGKVLNARVDPRLDEELEIASRSGTYNTAYKSILQSELTKYKTSLNQAYMVAKGPKGQALLKKSYADAEMLEKILNSNGG